MAYGVTRIKKDDGSWAPLKGLWRKAADGSWQPVKTAWVKTATGWRRIYPTQAGHATFSPTSLSGSVYTGDSTNGVVTLTNDGEDSLTVTAVSASNANCTGINLAIPITLSPGSSTSFRYTLTGSSTGTYTGTIDLTVNTGLLGSTTFSVPYSVTVLARYATLSAPSSISLTQRDIDNTPAAVINISNSGNGATLYISSVVSDQSGTAISGVPSSVAFGSSASFNVQPPSQTTPGTYRQNVTINSDSSQGQAVIPVTLTVNRTYGAIRLSTTDISHSYNFDDGAPSDTVTIYNDGVNTLNISSIRSKNGSTISGAPSSISAGSSATFTITAQNNRTYTDTVNVISDAGNVTNIGITLSYNVKKPSGSITFSGTSAATRVIPSGWYATSNEAPWAWSDFMATYSIWQGGAYSGGPYSYQAMLSFPETGTYTLNWSIDNYGYFYLDGAYIAGTYNSFYGQADETFYATAGIHYITITAVNQGGPAGIAAQIVAPSGGEVWNTLAPAGTVRTTGNQKFTVPAGVHSVDITLVGAGGGGGGSTEVGDGGAGGGGGGGGSVVYTKSVTPGEELTITVGAGGAGAPYVGRDAGYTGGGGNGGSGENTSVSGSFGTVTATGGAGGASGTGWQGGGGGAGGTPNGVNGSEGTTGYNDYSTTYGGIGGDGAHGAGAGGAGADAPDRVPPYNWAGNAGQNGVVIISWG